MQKAIKLSSVPNAENVENAAAQDWVSGSGG